MKPKEETTRRMLDRISRLERRKRQILHSPKRIDELSALEWAIPILERHVRIASDKENTRRKAFYKHEKQNIIVALLQRDGNRCYLCNEHMEPELMTIDHVIPLHKKGKDDMSNYRLAHEKCNLEKGNLMVEDYLRLKSEGKYDS